MLTPRQRTSVYCPVIVNVEPVVLLSDLMTTKNVSHMGLGFVGAGPFTGPLKNDSHELGPPKCKKVCFSVSHS